MPTAKKENNTVRQLQQRINLNYRPLSSLSMNLKVMPKSCQGHKLTLCITDEVTNYLVTVPMHHSRYEEICNATIDSVISKTVYQII